MAPYYNSTRDHDPQPLNLLSRVITALPGRLKVQAQRIWDRRNYDLMGTKADGRRKVKGNWLWRRVGTLPNLFVLVWVVVLLWGERWVFERAVKDCRWEGWERWPQDATPHHLIFIADPQLIDPHSYPGRPKPLERLTILLTDNYMKRGYIQLQKWLHPDTLFFLGDLFDGGREWKTAQGNTADPAWANGQRPSGEQALLKTWGKRYGEDFWLWEYERFGRIFYEYWNLGGDEPGPWQRNRRIISTLPGNHDLGFGANIKIPIRNRFEVYFGEGNRVDVIGNHTFVSVDAVSLSAGGSEHDTREITAPVEAFLDKVQEKKRVAVARELSLQKGEERTLQYSHEVEELDQVDFKKLPTLDPGKDNGVEFPTILLTHVPLYREPGTPCGPQRERHPPQTPPKGQTEPVFPDHGNAISISRGYQYQNVLSEDDSIHLIEKIGNVQSVFSGDDHDYCEIIHTAKKNNAHEITVKSMNFAQGVRKPGFLLVSMWNPISASGQPILSTPSGHGSTNWKPTTLQTHLCLLPDELSILINYGILIGITILTLTIRAILVPILNLTPFSGPSSSTSDLELDILPLTKQDLKKSDETGNGNTNNFDNDPSFTHSSTSSTNSGQGQLNVAARSSAARTRSVSPSTGYGYPPAGRGEGVRFATPPLINGAGYFGGGAYGGGRYSPPSDESGSLKGGRKVPSAYDVGKRKEKDTVVKIVWREAWKSVWRVTWVVVCVFVWFCWFG